VASANEPTDETLAGDAGSTLLVFEDLVCELRAVASSHVDEATALLTLSGIRFAFAIALSVLAALAVMLAWAIGCGAALYYVSLLTSLPSAVVIGVVVHLAVAVALFRFACREIGRVKACFSDAIDGDETTV
tara:strand:+ start:3838 stop:4233 length:396 start_codon:yes stop_codon:yes gene_type:complete